MMLSGEGAGFFGGCFERAGFHTDGAGALDLTGFRGRADGDWGGGRGRAGSKSGSDQSEKEQFHDAKKTAFKMDDCKV
ncbi:MAG: hypothetical protein ACJA16_003051 [Akkermansiaceae bacterium]